MSQQAECQQIRKTSSGRLYKAPRAYIRGGVLLFIVALLFNLILLGNLALAAGNLSITRTFQPSSADTYIDENKPTTDYGTSDTLDIFSRPSKAARILVQFDISSIPTGSTIGSSSLQMYLASAPAVDRTYNAHRVTSSWVETTTWSTMPTFNSTPTSNTNPGTTGDVWNSWVVSTDVSAYVSGTATNNGWLIKDNVEEDPQYEKSIYSSKEETPSTVHPTLVVIFTAPWDSHKTSFTGPVWGDSGSEPFDNTCTTVYMKGTGFATDSYNVAYYDGEGSYVLVAYDDNIQVTDGNLYSAYNLSTDENAVGNTWWHALVQPASGYDAFPTSYATAVADPDTYGLLANDSFYVAVSAIPEFPTVIAGIVVAGLCFGIYYWMRKRKLAYVKA